VILVDKKSIQVHATNNMFFECPMFGKEIPLKHTTEGDNIIVKIPYYLMNAVDEIVVRYDTSEAVE